MYAKSEEGGHEFDWKTFDSGGDEDWPNVGMEKDDVEPSDGWYELASEITESSRATRLTASFACGLWSVYLVISRFAGARPCTRRLCLVYEALSTQRYWHPSVSQ